MQEKIIELINEYGCIAIVFLMLVENVFPPIPSEAVLLFGGFMTRQTSMQVWQVIVCATAGSVIGAAVLYGAGFFLGKERLKKLFETRVCRVLRLKPESVDTADAWFGKYGCKAVLICRCIPIVRSIISIPAGLAKMKPVPFFLLTTVGSAFWNTVMVWIGVFAGSAWESSLKYVSFYTKVAALIIAAVCAAAFFIIKKSKREEE